MTTLHGTDITLVGSDPSYARVVRFSIEQSHAVTAVSESLKADTLKALGVRREIQVIANFLDCEQYRRRPDPALRARLCPAPCEALRHSRLELSSGQARGRGDRGVPRGFGEKVNARFVLLGDGPVREAARASGRRGGIDA